jgi:hypothetical protein
MAGIATQGDWSLKSALAAVATEAEHCVDLYCTRLSPTSRRNLSAAGDGCGRPQGAISVQRGMDQQFETSD